MISSFHLLLIITPKNFVDETQLTAAPCIMISSLAFLSLIYEIAYKLVFLILIVSLFAFNQAVTLSNSEFTVSISFLYSISSRNTLVSSAKRTAKNNLEALEKSFINNVKNNGPRIDLWC